MADDVSVEKVFNYICGNGGFVELSVLLKHPSPLGNIKSELEVVCGLQGQARRPFVAVKDTNGEIAGVRIDLRKKLCQQYLDKGSCRRARGKCKFWHICKGFIEGNCNQKCNFSHNFFDEDNKEKTKELGLEKFTNGTVNNVAARSLPQACQLYARDECKSRKCPYLHVCPQEVRGSSCHCALSHNLTDSHNKNILKQFELVPHQSMPTEFVRCSILVPKKQQVFDKRMECSSECSTTGGKTTNGALGNLVNPITPETVKSLVKLSTPQDHGAIGYHCNSTPEGASINISSSSRQSEFNCHSQMETRRKTKCRKPKRAQVKTSKQELDCRQTGPFNNPPSSKSFPNATRQYLLVNIQTGENETKHANFSFKTVKHMEEDTNVAKKSQKGSKMTTQYSDLAFVREMEEDREGTQTQESQQKRLDDANAPGRRAKESKMIIQSSDRHVKVNVEEVEKYLRAARKRTGSQQKILRVANDAKRTPEESKTNCPEEKMSEKETNFRATNPVDNFPYSKYSSRSTEKGPVPVNIQNVEDENCSDSPAVGNKTASFKTVKHMKEDTNAMTRSQKESKMTTQYSDLAFVKEMEENREGTQTQESQQKSLDDANAPERKAKESKVIIQSSDRPVKVNVEEVEKYLRAALKINGSQQERLRNANDAKRTPEESKTNRPEEKMSEKETNFRATNPVDNFPYSKSSSRSTENGLLPVNIKNVEDENCSDLTSVGNKTASFKIVKNTNQATNATTRSQEESKTTAQYSDLASVKEMEEYREDTQTQESQQKRLDDAHVPERRANEYKMIIQSSDRPVKVNVEEIGNDSRAARKRTGSQQERLRNANDAKRTPEESNTNCPEEKMSEKETIFRSTNPVNNFPYSKSSSRSTEKGPVPVNIQNVEDENCSDSPSVGNKTASFKSVKHTKKDTNATKRSQKESEKTAQYSDLAVVRVMEGDREGTQTQESQQKSLHDANASERRAKESKMIIQSSDRPVKVNVEEMGNDSRAARKRNGSQQERLRNANGAKRTPEESKTNCPEEKMSKKQTNFRSTNPVNNFPYSKSFSRPTNKGPMPVNIQNVEDENCLDSPSVGNKTASFKTVKHTKKDTNATKRSQKESEMTVQYSDLAVVRVMETDREGTQTQESQQKSLDANAPERRAKECKMIIQSSDRPVKVNVEQVEKYLRAALKINGSQQERLRDTNDAKRRSGESETTKKGMGSVVEVNVEHEERKYSGATRTPNELKYKRLRDANAGKRRLQESEMIAGKAKAVEERNNSGDTEIRNELPQKRLGDSNAAKRRLNKYKTSSRSSGTALKADVEEKHKDLEGVQTHNLTKQKFSCQPKSVNVANKAPVSDIRSLSQTTRMPVAERPSGLLADDARNNLVNVGGSVCDLQPLPASQTVEVDCPQNLSVSNTCSLGQVSQKCTTLSKKAIFNYILKEYNGSVSFDVITKRHDLFPQKCEDIASWFRARKDKFMLREKEGAILEVSVICRKARLCFKQMCSKKTCQYLHVCKDYIAGSCRCTNDCEGNRSFHYDEERKFISKLKLGGLTEENFRKVLQLSLPQVCLDYNDGCCLSGLSCGRMHICKNFIIGRCKDETKCRLEHKNAFLSLHTTDILRNYGLKIKDGNVNPVLKMVLVCESIPSGSEDCEDHTSSKKVDSRETSHDLPILSEGADVAATAKNVISKRFHERRSAKVPAQWSPKSSKTRYERFPLAPVSAEFKEVEKMCKKTIKQSAVIISIERVENSFMWKTYERKKGNMPAVKIGRPKREFLNERRLFHGSSHKTVKATCKQILKSGWRIACMYVCRFTQKEHHRLRRRKLLRFDSFTQRPLSQGRP